MTTPSAQATLAHEHKREIGEAYLRLHLTYSHQGNGIKDMTHAARVQMHHELHGQATFDLETQEADES